MKKFIVYLDLGDDAVAKCAIPAESRSSAEKFCQGNGEVIAVKDMTAEYPIDCARVHSALKSANFGPMEIDFICRTLQITGIAE